MFPLAVPLRPSRVPPRPGVARAVAVLDWTALAACLLTAGVFLFGGVRDHFAGILISVRSWHRPAEVVLLLIAVRHVCQRTPVMPVVWADRVATGWRASLASEVAPVFLSTRLAVLLVGYLAVVTIGVPASLERFRMSDNQAENLVARWDVSWYVSIVTTGYHWDGNPTRQQNVVFFPAFPAVMLSTSCRRCWSAA